MNKNFPLTSALTAFAAMALLSSCAHQLDTGGPQPSALRAATGASLSACAGLVGSFKFDNTSLVSAADVAAGSLMLAGQGVAAHCLVKGDMFKRTGSDGRPYAIGFEMRLPQTWNGRFYYQGNGGLDGSVQPAVGATGGGPITHALMQGFAVISSDAGHTGAQTPYFGAEPQARLDYGYQAVGKLTPMAKALIAAAYGKAPDRSYIGGCSNGGRHALVAAARYGDQYDGYLAGAPGYRLPNAALAQLWGAQQWATLATPGATVTHPMNPSSSLPDLASAFTPPERQLLAKAILAQCDALDGATDGMVQATQACQARFDIQKHVPTCSAERTGACLTAAHKTVIANSFAGGQTPSGTAVNGSPINRPIYSRFAYDPGVAGSNWATWKFTNSLALDPLAVGTVFRSAPGPVAPLTANIDTLFTQLSSTSDVYKESGLSLMTPPGHDYPANLAALQKRGAKIMLYHGVSDPVFSAEDTRQWLERVKTALGSDKADSFARYFPVPGMNHCSGGPAADQFDMLSPLVAWVEQGITPQAITASVRGEGNRGGANAELPKDWSATRTRPLCAYPSIATTYEGVGSKENANTFRCE